MKALMIGILCASILGAATATPGAATATPGVGTATPGAATATPGAGTATAPAPIPAMEKALAGATRYQLNTSTGTVGEIPPLTSTTIVVGAGQALRVYDDIATTKNGKTIHAAVYVAGTKVCTRLNTPRFSCKNALSDAVKAIKSLDPARLLVRPDVTVRVTTRAAKTVRGQACDGYTLTGRFTTGETATTLLYLAHGSNLPCELDGTIRVKLTNTDSNGKSVIKTYTGKLQWVWSRFNDPSLTIPNIPT